MQYGGGGEEKDKDKDIRLLELMLYNISLPLCLSFKDIVKNLCYQDKFLKYKFLKKYIRYAPRGKYDKLYSIMLENYKYYYYECQQDDSFMTMFLDDKLHKNAYLSGYFQNLIYFDKIESILKEEFRLKIPLQSHNQQLKTKIENTENSVFLHVRLGDYLKISATNGNILLLGKTYYQRAIDIIKEKVAKPHIFIFSNDIEWCEKNICNFLNFNGCNIEFIKGNSEGNAAEEMELMRVCKHAIIANSTFSWWAAYLIDNPNKQVIMPDKFFNNESCIPKANMLAKKGFIMVDPFWGSHKIV